MRTGVALIAIGVVSAVHSAAWLVSVIVRLVVETAAHGGQQLLLLTLFLAIAMLGGSITVLQTGLSRRRRAAPARPPRTGALARRSTSRVR